VQPLSAVKPWAVNLGNHETYDTANGIVAISARYRFHGMPFPVGSPDDIWYFSYEVGPAHIISVSSFYPGGFGPASPLTVWLKKDLATVDRSRTPWLLVSLHAPWYNSNTEHQGDGEAMRVALEPVFIAAGVNAIFCGHVHSYERSYPVNNNAVVPAGQGIVHFNLGDAGASLYTKWLKTPSWSAFHSASFGHGEFEILNATHGHFTWHQNAQQEPVVSDETYVINTHTS
jgi:acid phosphatase type 7